MCNPPAFNWMEAFQGQKEKEIVDTSVSMFSLPELRQAAKRWRLHAKGNDAPALAIEMASRIRTILV